LTTAAFGPRGTGHHQDNEPIGVGAGRGASGVAVFAWRLQVRVWRMTILFSLVTGEPYSGAGFKTGMRIFHMTKHVSPNELVVGTDYERPNLNGTITVMRERLRDSGEFFGIRTFDVSEDTGPVMVETERCDDIKESPENISLQVMQAGLAELFDKERSEEEAEKDSEKDSFEEDGKRLVRTKPRCNRNASTAPWSTIQITKKFKDDCADEPEPCSHFRFRNFVIPSAVNRFRCTVTWTPVRRQFRDIVKSDWLWLFWQIWRFVDRVPFLADIGGNTVPEGLRDATALPSRTRQEQYRIDHPENDSEILTRKPRNASPTREKDPLRLNAWAEYRRLNGSLEPLQTSYGKTDGDSYEYPDDAGTEGGEKPEAKYPLDSTFENRPSVEEMEACLANVVTMYPMTFLWHYIIVPVFHNIECIGFRKGIIHDLKPAAIESMGAFARRQAASRRLHWPVAKYAYDEKQIGIVVDRMEKPKQERLNVRDVDMSKPLSICRIGGLHFEPSGKLTHYQDKNGIKHWVKVDVPRKARGPAYLGSANQEDNDDMRRNGWGPRIVAMRSTRMALLSGEEKAENFANEEVAKRWSRASLRIQLRVPLKDESKLCRDIYHRSRRVPPRDSPMPRRWLPAPYDTPVRRPLRAYAFGKTYTLPKEPADDVVERGSTLAAVNAMLSPQGLRVANAIVHTELTGELAPTREGVGAMFRDGSMDTLRLRGNKAIDETADELILIFQKLASA
jgi:hypothetical protein